MVPSRIFCTLWTYFNFLFYVEKKKKKKKKQSLLSQLLIQPDICQMISQDIAIQFYYKVHLVAVKDPWKGSLLTSLTPPPKKKKNCKMQIMH